MKCAEESELEITHTPIDTPNELTKHIDYSSQSSLELYDYYGPYKNTPNLPYLDNPVLGLIDAVKNQDNYPGFRNLTAGNTLFAQGRYKLAIKKYVLNTLPESMERRYTLIDHKWDSLVGIARCYLKLDDISSSINYLHQARLFYESIAKDWRFEKSNLEIFKDLRITINNRHRSEIETLNNSLDTYEFIGDLMKDKSGWSLATEILVSLSKEI